jgi:hypothetical protein
MTSFNVHGWFGIEYEKRKGGRTLVFDNFWSEGSKAHYLADERGCYVFAIKTGRGLEPIYVGKATKTFKQETFNPANKHKYHDGFSEYAKGLPLMFFVVHPDQKGKTNKKQIEKIEQFLIQAGAAKNPELQNVEGHIVPNGVFEGLFAAAGKVSVPKPRGRFADCLI